MLDKIFKIIKESYKYILVFLVLFLICTYKLPYYIESPGGIINTDKRINIDSNNKIKGTFNLAYVSEMNATIPAFLYSKINNDWDAVKKDEVVYTNETEDDVDFRDHLLLDEANNTAIKVAYNKALKKVEVLKNEMYIVYIDEISKTNLKITDKIISIDGKTFSSKYEINKYIKSKKVGDKLDFKVINNNKEYDRYAKVIKYQNKKMIGIIISEKQELKTDPKIKIKFKDSESGPSGGLMMTLSIYNKLVQKDLTHGLKIAGTGTIDEFGNVGEIDGIKYKIIGANKNNVDVFLVASDNYKEAVKIKKEKNYKMKVIEIKTFDDAVDYLETLK